MSFRAQANSFGRVFGYTSVILLVASQSIFGGSKWHQVTTYLAALIFTVALTLILMKRNCQKTTC